MKITKKLKEETVSELVGEDVLPIMNHLIDKENISEFMIAEKLKYEVNHIRNILYRMFKHNIVTYHRKKDRIKGWYISYWTLNTKRIEDLVLIQKQKKIEQLKFKLDKEQANEGLFFICPNLCVRVNFDQGTNLNFKCPECGSILTQQDNTKTIENMKRKVAELEEEIK
jgi:transcription initiation factor TFIIE subunit alpha